MSLKLAQALLTKAATPTLSSWAKHGIMVAAVVVSPVTLTLTRKPNEDGKYLFAATTEPVRGSVCAPLVPCDDEDEMDDELDCACMALYAALDEIEDKQDEIDSQIEWETAMGMRDDTPALDPYYPL